MFHTSTHPEFDTYLGKLAGGRIVRGSGLTLGGCRNSSGSCRAAADPAGCGSAAGGSAAMSGGGSNCRRRCHRFAPYLRGWQRSCPTSGGGRGRGRGPGQLQKRRCLLAGASPGSCGAARLRRYLPHIGLSPPRCLAMAVRCIWPKLWGFGGHLIF
jgi:hypothetical protein